MNDAALDLISIPSRTAVASRVIAAQSERTCPLGSYASPHRLTGCILFMYLSSLSSAPHGRYHLR